MIVVILLAIIACCLLFGGERTKQGLSSIGSWLIFAGFIFMVLLFIVSAFN